MEVTLEVLKFLSSPFENESNDEWILKEAGSAEILIDEIVEKCKTKIELAEFSKNVSENCGPATPSWKLTVTALDLLLKLKDEVEDVEKTQPEDQQSIEVLSLQSQINIQKCLELIIGFGLLPYLLPNVGIPEKVRKKNRLASELFLQQDHPLVPLIKFNRLAQVIDMLLEIATHPSFHVLIIPRHCADILAGLLQITKVPIAKPNSTKNSLNQMEYDYVMALRERFEVHYEHFFLIAPKSLLVSSLFLIGERPKFMQIACADAISKIIMSPNGLILVASTLLSETSATNVWSLARNISHLMRNSLSRMKPEEEFTKAFSEMCSQCLQMIYTVHHQSQSTNQEERHSNSNTNIEKESEKLSSQSSAPFAVHKELSRIGLYCCLVLMDMNCQKCKLLVWDHLFNPVLTLGGSQIERKSISDNSFSGSNNNASTNRRLADEMMISTDIKKVTITCDILEGLLSLVIPWGISIPLQSFQPIWSLVFEIFCTCKKYEEKKIQEHNVSQLAQNLKSKLENILILLIEVVSSGFGDKLDLNGSKEKSSGSIPKTRAEEGSNSKHDFEIGKKKEGQTKFNNHRDTKALCEFCIELLVYEINGEVCRNNLELKSVSNSLEMSEMCINNEVRESVKIVRNVPDESTSSEDKEGSRTSDGISNDGDNAFELLEVECAYLSCILKDERLTHIASELFREFLNYEYENVASQESENSLRKEGEKLSPSKIKTVSSSLPSSSKSQSSTSKELTQLEIDENIKKKKSLRKFVALKLLSELGGDESTVENVVKTEDYRDTLLIVELVMKKLAVELKDCTGENYEFTQSIIFALGFLGTIVETASTASSQNVQKEENEIWDELVRFVPHLKLISESDNLTLANSGVGAMAANILINIETRGKGRSTKDKVRILSPFEKALQDVANPMLPIKGHGLLQLRRLIEEKDPETLKNDRELLVIFQKELVNEDSYVYLMAIQGLASLGLKFHPLVVPVLIQEYDFDFTNPSTAENDNGCSREKMYRNMTNSERIECRMKIGEVLVKIIQKLGDMAPVYRTPLTNLFFRVVRDDEPLIKASALSNLGELCHLLKFSLGVVLTEVWYNVESILNFEKDIHVRRAALHLLVLLLKGVEKEFSANYLLTNEDLGSHLRDVRRLLTRIQQNEQDPVAKTHAQLALDELGLIAKKILLPKSELEYKIRIINSLE